MSSHHSPWPHIALPRRWPHQNSIGPQHRGAYWRRDNGLLESRHAVVCRPSGRKRSRSPCTRGVAHRYARCPRSQQHASRCACAQEGARRGWGKSDSGAK
eukprot:172509-Prymnesium_polylepis.1